MTVIKFDPNRRKKRKPAKKQPSYRILESHRIRLAITFLLCAAFFQLLRTFPDFLIKLPLAFAILAVFTAALEGAHAARMWFAKTKKDNVQL
ncbi:hypothetical protein [Zhaonella formicivorans]|uniref:hypothetical protein n=1 Tax=Zhaonella formicivorans TaxID=2528593 RepID=UPI0010EAC632|nr:hypothetical protein [Zhaonella formicivorans]